MGTYFPHLDKRNLYKKKIERDLKQGLESLLVAEKKGKIIASIISIYDPWHSFIYHLAVHPKYQCKGIGTKLTLEAERKLKEKGAESVTLFIEENNDGVLEFYKKLGYEVIDKSFGLQKKL